MRRKKSLSVHVPAVVFATACLLTAGLPTGVLGQTIDLQQTINPPMATGELKFDLFAVTDDFSKSDRLSPSMGKLTLVPVTLGKMEPLELLSKLQSRTSQDGFRFDGDFVEFLYRVNSTKSLDDLAKKPSIYVPAAQIVDSQVKEGLGRGEQLLISLDTQEKRHLRAQLSDFEKNASAAADAGGDDRVKDLIMDIRPLAASWSDAVDARHLAFSKENLDLLNEQYGALNDITAKFIETKKLDDAEFAQLEEIRQDGKYQEVFLAATLGNDINPTVGTKLDMNVEVDLFGDEQKSRQLNGVTIFFSKPYLPDPRQARRAGVSSPVTLSALYGTYCVWAEDPEGTLVTSVAMVEPPTQFGQHIPPVELIYVGKKAKRQLNRCQWPG